MPNYEHVCTDTECNHEWEDTYSIKLDPPTICPKCLKETAKRVIGYATPGKVELAGQDYIDSIKADAKKLKREMHTNENMYANMLGESKYQSLKSSYDKSKRK